MASNEPEIILKLLLLGNTMVGKTSILLKYSENRFEEHAISTIGVDYIYKDIIYNDLKIKLQIWDTSGEERFRSITRNFYRNTDALFLVFDLTKKDSFECIKNWLTDAKEYNSDLKIILVGNKIDLVNEREVPEEKAKNFATKNKLEYIETSAKDGTNIQNAFDALIAQLLNGKSKQDILTEFSHKDSSFSVETIKSEKKKKKSCC